MGKRAVPMAVVVAATKEGTDGPNDISANEQDDYEYELGTTALPPREPSGRLGHAAVVTRVETGKAKAGNKARSAAALGPQIGAAAVLRSKALGTVRRQVGSSSGRSSRGGPEGQKKQGSSQGTAHQAAGL